MGKGGVWGLEPQPLLSHMATIGVAPGWVGWAVLLPPVATPLRVRAIPLGGRLTWVPVRARSPPSRAKGRPLPTHFPAAGQLFTPYVLSCRWHGGCRLGCLARLGTSLRCDPWRASGGA